MRSVAGLAYGGDYNPEQWSRPVWREDVALMREAGVNLVTVGVFAWAMVEPVEGHYELGWLDEVLDLLAESGVGADLATATASPPPWFSRAYPETRPVTVDGVRLGPGGRQAWCPSSPVYRAKAVELATALAGRYREHPALRMWHVGNEYGCHNAMCYCDVSAEAFRSWLRERYADIDALNAAWGTAFWSQRYASFEEVEPPRRAPTFVNPTQQLDFRRFSSAEHLACFRAERDVLHEHTPDVPVTTNFMVMPQTAAQDYWSWSGEVDLVANDHYLRAEEPDAHIELAFCADVTRGLARGLPWLLMEHSTSAVNWQPRNLAKAPGAMARNSLQHIARGADGAMFFQWRASAAGAEKFHSGMLPHAGTESRIWREVVELGRTLRALEPVADTTVRSDVAMVVDWQAWWACELDSHPSVDVGYLDQALAVYRALWELGVTVDVVAPGDDAAGYRLLVVPTLYLVDDAAVAAVSSFVERGSHLLMTYFSGIVDQHDHIRLGGYPGAFRDLLGVRTEEFCPLAKDEHVRLSDGSTGSVWAERGRCTDAEPVATYVDGPAPGSPAVTRRGEHGVAWYVSTSLDRASLARLLQRVCADAGVRPVADASPGVEVVRRCGEQGRFLFVLNHTDTAAEVAANGVDLVSGRPVDGRVEVAAGAVAVVRERDEAD